MLGLVSTAFAQADALLDIINCYLYSWLQLKYLAGGLAILLRTPELDQTDLPRPAPVSLTFMRPFLFCESPCSASGLPITFFANPCKAVQWSSPGAVLGCLQRLKFYSRQPM